MVHRLRRHLFSLYRHIGAANASVLQLPFVLGVVGATLHAVSIILHCSCNWAGGWYLSFALLSFESQWLAPIFLGENISIWLGGLFAWSEIPLQRARRNLVFRK